MIDWLLKPRASTYQGGINPSEDGVLYRLFGKKTKSGADVNEGSAMGIPAFQCGVRKIANTCKVLPVNKHTRLPNGDKAQVDDASSRLFKIAPNDELTPSRLKWLMAAWTILWGNFYAEIERDGFGDPLALWPIHPSRVCTERDRVSGRIVHRVQNKGGSWVTIKSEDMLHCYGITSDGISGISVIGFARESLGMTIAVNEYGAKFFGNNAMPAHLVIRQEELDPESLANFRRGWMEQNSGDNSGGIHFLGGGDESTKVHTLSTNNADSQFLESKQFQNSEIGRLLIINPIKLYEMGRATWGNSEQVAIEYIGDSVLPLIQDFEEEFNKKLLRPAQRETHYFKFNTAGQYRGELKAQAESFTMGLNNGWWCVDEVRELMDLNPLPDGQGKIYMRPANMTSSAEMVAKIARIKAGTADTADVEFLRDVVKSFLGDKTTNDVIYNLTGIGELMKLVGLPTEPNAVAPWLPVIADAGPLVSGGTVKDAEGDVVGGDVLPTTADLSGNPSNPPEPPPADETKDGPADQPETGDSGNAAPPNDTLVAAFAVTLGDAMNRMGRVKTNAEKRIAKAADKAAARADEYKAIVETCRDAFGPTFDGLALAAGVTDATAVMGYTARAAEGFVYSGLAADLLVRGFIQEFAK